MHKSCKSKVKWYAFLIKIFQKSSVNFLEKHESGFTIAQKQGTSGGAERDMNAINKRIGLPPVGKDEKNPYRYM